MCRSQRDKRKAMSIWTLIAVARFLSVRLTVSIDHEENGATLVRINEFSPACARGLRGCKVVEIIRKHELWCFNGWSTCPSYKGL